MTRPNIVRADTLDLQPRENTSAQDHSGAPSSPKGTHAPLGASQSQAIRNVVEEQAQAQHDIGGDRANGHSQEEDELEQELADAEIAGDEGGFDDDDMLDKMSSSPSIADEDIDFEMVYALHNFNATVEGQANAAKGEHMVLLDDSNSYWWLVRIVRDSSIGYLPAEHIETPTERLARLNKHRNIDLSANMLTDLNGEKSKNPIKKALRRRHAKNVAFTDPTYIEASEYEYSDDEDGEDGYFTNDEDDGHTEEVEDVDADGKEKSTDGAGTNGTAADEKVAQVSTNAAQVQEIRSSSDASRGSEENVRMRANPTPASLRHPDSAIFNDESKETKKLTLTPNLLRDDAVSGSPTNKEVIKGRSSMDRGEKQQPVGRDSVLSPPPGKDGRRLKKGGSVLGNLFKKRSKKGRKEEEEEVEEWLHSAEKRSIDSKESIDSFRDSQGSRTEEARKEKEKEDAMRAEEQRRQEEKERQKEEQQERAKLEQQRRQQEQQRQQREIEEQQRKARQQQQAGSTIRTVQPDDDKTADRSLSPLKSRATVEPAQQPERTSPVMVRAPETTKSNMMAVPQAQRGPRSRSPTVASPSPTEQNQDQPKSVPVHAPLHIRKRSTETNDEKKSPSTATPTPTPAPLSPRHVRTPSDVERLSESPEQITYHDAVSRPDLLVDTSPGTPASHDTVSPIDSSPEIIERSSTFDSTTSPATTADQHAGSAQSMARTWSDWSLRTYFEDDTDVRDMLIVVQQDRGGGTPAGEVPIEKDHPEIKPLFEDSNRRLADITKRLDGMLGDWLQRRNNGVRTPVPV